MTTGKASRGFPCDVWWTPWPGTGPGTDILGPVTGRLVIELGCGKGDNAAALAAAGANVIAIDKSAGAIHRARGRWRHRPRLTFICDDAASYLAAAGPYADIICSIFGAFTFTPADDLLTLVAKRLTHDGQVAAALRLPAVCSPGGSSRDRPPVRRYTYTPDAWASELARNGLAIARAIVVQSPTEGTAATLVATATPTGDPSQRA